MKQFISILMLLSIFIVQLSIKQANASQLYRNDFSPYEASLHDFSHMPINSRIKWANEGYDEEGLRHAIAAIRRRMDTGCAKAPNPALCCASCGHV